ncbi:MAG: ABC transporter permease [Oscillospiraceae bacterium]|nr:ABC transporter permease [Oscillospiraceae bacterium]
MRYSMLRRTTLREIKGSFGRFLAILSIIALGVGFFTGVRGTTPAMKHTVNNFLQEKQFFDYRLISTLGWEEANLEAFRSQPDVRAAEGSHTIDVLCVDDAEHEFTFKTHTILQNINLLELTEGRMPEASDECIIDAGMGLGLSIGDKIYISDQNEDDTKDSFLHDAYTIVGAAHSSYYLNFERGTTSLGNGSVSGYLYLPPDAYDLDYYSEIFVRFDQDDMIYSKAYKNAMDDRQTFWEELTQEQADARYDRIVREAEEELQDGRDELEEKRAEGLSELHDAIRELGDGKRELADAAKELADAEEQLNDAKRQLEDAAKELEDAAKELEDGQAQLDDGKKTLDDSKAQLDAAAQTLADSEAQLNAGQAQLDAARAEVDSQESLLLTQEQQLDAQEAELNDSLPYLEMLPPEQQEQIRGGLAAIAEGRAQIGAARAQIGSGRQELAAQQAVIDAGRAQLATGRAEYEQGLAAYNDGLRTYEDSVKQLADGKAKYEQGLLDYENVRQEYEDGLQKYEDGKQEYEDGVREYEDGWKEYLDGRAEFDEKIADAEADIAEAEQEIADIAHPDTFVLDRSTNIGYACFESDSEIVEQVARVFPLFFILVAALVCMTTMSRMVEEQRTQIGTLKALGYSEGRIMGKFAFYAGSAAVIGCVLGFSVGSVLFPSVIWMSYQLMYIPLKLVYVFDPLMAVLALAASLLCSIGTTWLSCRIELNTTAAGLMRPKAPKAGKRIFLEYLPFLWNRLKFLHKVSIRNIFRYKGRFFMMIVGIGGCTALLVTGFGLRDSVSDFAQVQYNEIVVADAQMSFKNGLGSKLPAKLEAQMEELTDEYLLLHQTTLDLVTKDKTKGMNLIVPFETADFSHYMHLHTMDGEPLTFPANNEAYISNSIHDRFNVQLGDTITLRNEEMQEVHVKVTGIFENHVYNYVLLTPETLRGQLGETPSLNGAYLNFAPDADSYQIQAALSRSDDVTNVTLFEELQTRMAKMMSSLDYIVLLVIACAAGLAFIVLYNLTNINITERIREIATIKVLGFFRSETEAYVLRENLVLTAFGILAGLGLGVLLHRFVISQIIVDLVSFKVQILPLSFVWSVLLTFGFNLLVNLVMGLKLDRINMAESLKSVD